MRGQTTSVWAPHVAKRPLHKLPNKRGSRRITTVNMGRSAIERQGGHDGQIVAFDFDGTLSIRDSFKAFLAWRSGPVMKYATM